MLASIHQDYILNSTTKGICICDWNGRVLVMNDVFYEMFKIPERKIKGAKLYLSPHIPSLSRFEAYRMFREIQMAKTKREYDAIRVRNDGMRIHVEIEGSSLQMGYHALLMITYSFKALVKEDEQIVTMEPIPINSPKSINRLSQAK